MSLSTDLCLMLRLKSAQNFTLTLSICLYDMVHYRNQDNVTFIFIIHTKL